MSSHPMLARLCRCAVIAAGLAVAVLAASELHPLLAARAAGVSSSGALGRFDHVTKALYKPGAGVVLALAPLVALIGAGLLLTGSRHAMKMLGMGVGIFAVVAAI